MKHRLRRRKFSTPTSCPYGLGCKCFRLCWTVAFINIFLNEAANDGFHPSAQMGKDPFFPVLSAYASILPGFKQYHLLWIIVHFQSFIYISRPTHPCVSTAAAIWKTTSANIHRPLALSLFVFWIFTDYSDTTFSLDDFALFANRFHRWSNLHSKVLLSSFPSRGHTPPKSCLHIISEAGKDCK